MAKDRQGLHFSELVWESTEQNMEIPPRDAGKPDTLSLQDPKPKKKAEDAVQIQLWDMEDKPEPVTTTESQFVARARELAGQKEPAALFVPFKSYWPTYGHMTGAQSRWYFFWRDEVRQGRYPKTDLSYIFLHVYELINGVGWDEPQDGYRQLGLLWEAYRDQYKRLDQYLGGWIADFAFVHKLEVPLSGIVARSRGLAGDLAEMELMRCLTAAPEQLTFQVLTVMSDYDISKSKFYSGEGKEAAEHYIPLVVALIDAYVVRKHGTNLVGMFPPGPSVMRERYLFRSAVYDISLYGYSVLVPVVRISKSPSLRSLITRLFRLTENKLRELMGYRGRLKGIKIDADMDELITKYLQREFRKAEQEAKGPAVVIDQKKLEQLQSDSEVVRTLLTVEDTEVERSYDTGKDIPDPVTPVNSEKGMPLSERTLEAAPGRAEEIQALELKKETGQELPELTAVTEQAAGTVSPAGGNLEWEQLRSGLTPLHRDVLLALAEDNGLPAVNRLAAAAGTMPELLFDEINELAMDLLGDLLIDGEQITDEYIPMLHYLMR